MKYVLNEYDWRFGGGTCVTAFKGEELFAVCSVNLFEYGYVTMPDEIFIPVYKLTKKFVEKLREDIVEEVIEEIHFGPFEATALWVRLKRELLENGELECGDEKGENE